MCGGASGGGGSGVEPWPSNAAIGVQRREQDLWAGPLDPLGRVPDLACRRGGVQGEPHEWLCAAFHWGLQCGSSTGVLVPRWRSTGTWQRVVERSSVVIGERRCSLEESTCLSAAQEAITGIQTCNKLVYFLLILVVRSAHDPLFTQARSLLFWFKLGSGFSIFFVLNCLIL